ncbi:unnamed protein product [Mytilus coruscus]|uniref:DNA 3'-5' helicase n=1 Tax=Mytilus coruscus TaxID=42192 RepID=A0A6J8CY80_MYTCO|nr:unnamed protein product [Mytilus coruscus]
MALESKKIRGTAIMKDAPAEDIKAMKDGNVDIVFVSPEILKGKTLDDLRLLESQICLLVFDECHCISEWGLDFRPEYRKVADIISLFASCPTLLLTATATEKIQEDLYSLLALDNDTKVVAVLPDRPNVYLHVEKKVKQEIGDNLAWLLDLIKDKQELTPKTIIYCTNIYNCNSVYMWLMEELGKCAYHHEEEKLQNRFIEMFHSRTDTKTAERVLTNFKLQSNKIRVICATVAFGIGINIPDVEYVINWGAPVSVMTFWQETGRCGRDGRQGLCITYPYGRSLLGSEEQLKSILKGDICYRRKILSMFTLKGMEKGLLKTKDCESEKCESCSCERCCCCSICFENCKCKGKVKSKF